MNEQELEQRLQQSASAFPYPPTPNIASAVMERLTNRSRPSVPLTPRLSWAVAIVLVIITGLLAVPQVRAAVFEIIRAGAITIFVGEPTPTAIPATPVSEIGAALPITATPEVLPEETGIFDLAGRTTMEEARAQVSFPLRIPGSYGLPNEFYLQKIADPGMDGQVVIMEWLDPVQPERALLRLFQISIAHYGLKSASIDSVAETRVNGETAFWVEGGHSIRLQSSNEQESYFVERNVLIWVEGEVTYRLESGLSMEEAVEIAESLRPVEEGE